MEEPGVKIISLIKNGYYKEGLTAFAGMVLVLIHLYQENKLDRESIYNFLQVQSNGWEMQSETIKLEQREHIQLGDKLFDALSGLLCELDVFEDCIHRHKDHKEKGECMNTGIMEMCAIKLLGLDLGQSPAKKILHTSLTHRENSKVGLKRVSHETPS